MSKLSSCHGRIVSFSFSFLALVRRFLFHILRHTLFKTLPNSAKIQKIQIRESDTLCHGNDVGQLGIMSQKGLTEKPEATSSSSEALDLSRRLETPLSHSRRSRTKIGGPMAVLHRYRAGDGAAPIVSSSRGNAVLPVDPKTEERSGSCHYCLQNSMLDDSRANSRRPVRSTQSATPLPIHHT